MEKIGATGILAISGFFVAASEAGDKVLIRCKIRVVPNERKVSIYLGPFKLQSTSGGTTGRIRDTFGAPSMPSPTIYTAKVFQPYLPTNFRSTMMMENRGNPVVGYLLIEGSTITILVHMDDYAIYHGGSVDYFD